MASGRCPHCSLQLPHNPTILNPLGTISKCPHCHGDLDVNKLKSIATFGMSRYKKRGGDEHETHASHDSSERHEAQNRPQKEMGPIGGTISVIVLGVILSRFSFWGDYQMWFWGLLTLCVVGFACERFKNEHDDYPTWLWITIGVVFTIEMVLCGISSGIIQWVWIIIAGILAIGFAKRLLKRVSGN